MATGLLSAVAPAACCRARAAERRAAGRAAPAPPLRSPLAAARLRLPARPRVATPRPCQPARASLAMPAPERVPASLPVAPLPPTLAPSKVFETAVNISVTKAGFTWQKVAMLSFLAGAQIGLGALLMTIVGGGSPGISAANPGLGRWLNGAIGLPVGLSMVMLTGGELFTGNVFFMLAGLLSKKVTASQLGVNWAVSFLGNFVGSLFVAALTYLAGTTAIQPWLGTTLTVATYKASLPFVVAFTRGIMCNWMVCTAVWIATAAQSPAGKFLGIWLLVSSFVAMGFEHSIANMFLVPLGMLNGAAVASTTFLMQNLLPVTLGNIVGGGLLIAFCYWYAYGDSPAASK